MWPRRSRMRAATGASWAWADVYRNAKIHEEAGGWEGLEEWASLYNLAQLEPVLAAHHDR